MIFILAKIGRIVAWIAVSILIGAIVDPMFPAMPRGPSLQTLQLFWACGCGLAGWIVTGIPGWRRRRQMERLAGVSMVRYQG